MCSPSTKNLSAFGHRGLGNKEQLGVEVVGRRRSWKHIAGISPSSRQQRDQMKFNIHGGKRVERKYVLHQSSHIFPISIN
jgi:hypothetical protein